MQSLTVPLHPHRSPFHRAIVLTLGVAVATSLAACGSASKTGTAPTTTASRFGSGGTSTGGSASARTKVPGTVRVVNLYAPGGNPQAMDIYDDSQPSDNPKPIATDVAYGTVSKPFSLTVGQGGTAAAATIYGVAAGTKPTKLNDFHQLETVGFAADATSLVVVGTNSDAVSALKTDPLALADVEEIYEKDPSNEHGGPTVTAPAGKGLVAGESFAFLNVKAADGTPVSVTYFVDGVCGARAGNDTGTTMATIQSKGTVDNYVVAPGSHTVQLFVSGSNTGVCSNMSPLVAKTSVTASSGKVAYAFAYGTAAAPKLLVVPAL